MYSTYYDANGQLQFLLCSKVSSWNVSSYCLLVYSVLSLIFTLLWAHQQGPARIDYQTNTWPNSFVAARYYDLPLFFLCSLKPFACFSFLYIFISSYLFLQDLLVDDNICLDFPYTLATPTACDIAYTKVKITRNSQLTASALQLSYAKKSTELVIVYTLGLVVHCPIVGLVLVLLDKLEVLG